MADKTQNPLRSKGGTTSNHPLPSSTAPRRRAKANTTSSLPRAMDNNHHRLRVTDSRLHFLRAMEPLSNPTAPLHPSPTVPHLLPANTILHRSKEVMARRRLRLRNNTAHSRRTDNRPLNSPTDSNLMGSLRLSNTRRTSNTTRRRRLLPGTGLHRSLLGTATRMLTA